MEVINTDKNLPFSLTNNLIGGIDTLKQHLDFCITVLFQHSPNNRTNRSQTRTFDVQTSCSDEEY